ncbi:hypothetical protein [Nocardia lasii]|uniref:Uncharacterized protein n=1 Tax=Nocardia lasii TaxID=1616107 RepID=A0ABW1JWK3_9NOCA
MKHSLWERLSPESRAQVDELIVRHRKLPAIMVVRDALDDPRPGIFESQQMLFERHLELGTPWVRITPPLDLDELTARVAALPRTPSSIDARWDSDTDGWFVTLTAIATHPDAEHHLALLRHGTDIRLLTDNSSPWSEATEATTIGPALAARFGLPFHFERPGRPPSATGTLHRL